ncbi:hypothetical protein GYMLUDRAFT_37374 [Collybiopsis luxurians FD-317 M1]|nr:hypothetical protein GYMLUDRAFT_37374 [Collybiopsis luxurians FD-317 M1]
MAEHFVSSSHSSDHDTDYWQFSPPTSYFPISDARDSPWTTEQFVQAGRTRRETYALQASSPKRAIDIELPKIHQISGGFLRDNDRLLYTAKHPLVLKCLEYAREHWSLPPKTPSNILALAALETFLNPFHPGHWLLWSNECRDQSAKLIQSHLMCRNPTIYHPFSWSTLDWRWRLSGLHNKQLPRALSHLPWYDLLVLPTFLKDSPRGPVLRKRKAPPPPNIRTPSNLSDQMDNLKSLPTRKHRTTRARALAAPPEIEDPIDIPNLGAILTSTTQTLSESNVPMASQNQLIPPLFSPPPATSATSSPCSLPVDLPPPAHSPTRSSSRLSAQTLVDETREGSPSVSSSTTVTEPVSSKARSRRKIVDNLDTTVVGVIDVLPEDDTSSVALSFIDEEVRIFHPRLTRSRNGSTKKNQTKPIAPLGPQRSQTSRKSRANNILPYPPEKAGRVSAGYDTAEKTDQSNHDALAPSSAPKKVRKAKNRRR